jgi:sec-independent protein translocase protein TatA
MDSARKRHMDVFMAGMILYIIGLPPGNNPGLKSGVRRWRIATAAGGSMFGLGIGELLIILVIVMVLFSRRLPDLGEAFGKTIKKFRKAVNEPDEIDVTPKNDSRKD